VRVNRLNIWNLLLVLLCVYSINAQAQRRSSSFNRNHAYEMGLSIGPTYYQGDLSYGPVTLQMTKLHAGIYGRYYLGNFLAVRLGFDFARIAGDDKVAASKYDEYTAIEEGGVGKQADYRDRMKRNLNFYSNIAELNMLFEYHIWNPYNRGSGKLVVPYVFGGLAYFHFNPKTVDRYGTIVELRNFQTEYHKTYSLNQFAIPMGVGVKINPGAAINVSFEIGYRKTFTDWLDDVHHNFAGAPAANDVYLQQLSDRSSEVDPKWGQMWSQTSINPNKYVRGNPKDKDSYILCSINITKTFSSHGSCTNF